MPNRKKWADFELVDTVVKKHRQRPGTDETYAIFKCPYNCGTLIELPASNVANNKSTECHKHLMKCTGVSDGGVRAADDTRVAEQRRLADACQTQMRAAKRGCVEVGASADCQLCVVLRNSNGDLTSQNTQLASNNGELKDRVSDLEAQMSELRVENAKKLDAVREEMRGEIREEIELMRKEMQGMREELAQLRPLAPLVQRITNELGMVGSVPPAAPVDVYVEKIEGLRKAAALGGAGLCDKASKKSKEAEKAKQKEVEAMKRAVAEKEKQLRNAEPCIRFWNTFSDMFVDPVESEALLKKISVHSHPDKNPGVTHAAQGLQKGLNELRRQVAESRG